MERDGVELVIGQCSPGDWVRLGSGWWQLGQPLAGGIGARPSRGDRRIADLGQQWPAILECDEVVLEHRPVERSRKGDGQGVARSTRQQATGRAA